MSEIRQFRLVDLLLFLAIVVVAAGARGWYLTTYAGDNPALQVQEPQDELKALVENLKQDRAFRCRPPYAVEEEPTAYMAPGYPALLAAIGQLPLGSSSIEGTARWIQWGLGALTAGFFFLFARRAFRSRLVGALAGLLCALHPFWIANTAEINDGVLTSFLLATSITLGARGGQWGGVLTSLLYGLALAALALVRAATLPFAFVALLWFLLRCRSISRGWLCAVLALLGFTNPLALWTLRNQNALHELVPVVDSVPYHLWMGNNPRATGGPLPKEAVEEALGSMQGEEAKKTPERLRQLGSIARESIENDPTGAVQRRLWAGLYFFFGEDWFTQRKLWRGDLSDSGKGPEWLSRSYPVLLSGAMLGMLLLGVLGWRWTFGWGRGSMPASLAVMWIPLPYLLSHAEALHGPRLPLDGVLLCYAAFVLACVVPTTAASLLSRVGSGDHSNGRHEAPTRAAAWK